MHPRDAFEPLPSPLDREQDFGPVGSQVVQVLKGIYDPEIPVPVWDLGLIYLLDVDDDNNVYIKMTLTAPNCPAAESMPAEIPVPVWDLGLIYLLDVDDENNVYIKMTLTAPNCPAAESMPAEIQEKIGFLPDVKSVKLDLTFDPPYHPDYMSDEAKIILGFL